MLHRRFCPVMRNISIGVYHEDTKTRRSRRARRHLGRDNGKHVRGLIIIAIVIAGSVGRVEAETPVTFSKNIAPIVFAKCGMCHHPEGAAPFSLLSYSTARAHATQIASATKRRFMP